MNLFLPTGKWLFFIGFSVLFLLTLVFLLSLGKADAFFAANSFHNAGLDVFFTRFTFFGDGLFALLLCSILFIKHKHFAISVLYGFLLSGLIVQIIKRSFNSPRPTAFFPAGTYNHFIDGVALYSNGSFPSGHTATAFALAAVAAMFIKKQWVHVPILLAACLVGFSRVYTGQHFVGDVLVGSLLGFLCAFPAIILAKKTLLFAERKNWLKPRKSKSEKLTI